VGITDIEPLGDEDSEEKCHDSVPPESGAGADSLVAYAGVNIGAVLTTGSP
jgi:hypothetical protein